jgi:hypothetical protein
LEVSEAPPAPLREPQLTHEEIELINFLVDRGAAFVNFTSIYSAQKAVAQIQQVNPDYAEYRISFGSDRCAEKRE